MGNPKQSWHRTSTASARVSCVLHCLPVIQAPPARQAACHATTEAIPNDRDFDEVGWHRVGVTPAKPQHVLCACLDVQRRSANNADLHRPIKGASRWMLIAPHPPHGGFRRPSNIMRIMRSGPVAQGPNDGPAPPAHCPLRRIISIMYKWPRRWRSKRCVANNATQQH